MTNEATSSISVNATTLWVKELDPKSTGSYIDSFLLLTFGGIPWQVSYIDSFLLLIGGNLPAR
jgi:high affinity choline transporter 7